MYNLVSATTVCVYVCVWEGGPEHMISICEYHTLPQQGLAIERKAKTGYSTDMILQNHHTSIDEESKYL